MQTILVSSFMSQFYELPVKQIVKTTKDCVVVSFDIKEEWKELFTYKQGQYLTLKTTINDEEIRRSYSLCSSPLDNEWKVAVKRVPDGRFSTFANKELKTGDVLEVMPPNGRFYIETDPKQDKDYLAFAAGSGITPILSIIKTHLQQEPLSSFKLFYVNQTVASIILKEEIEALKNQYLERFEVFHFLTREERFIPLYDGRINEEKLNIIFEKIVNPKQVNDIFICGPDEMIFMIRDYLLAKDFTEKQVHFELFNTGSQKKKKKTEAVVVEGENSAITILEGGKSFKFTIPQNSDNILDAALKQSADLPFACKGGVCCTCKAMLVEGTVNMEVNYGLEKEEIEQGYILTCQALPTSEKIVVNFDA